MTTTDSILPLELRDVCYDAGGRRLIKSVSCRFSRGVRGATGLCVAITVWLSFFQTARYLAWTERRGKPAAPG